MIEFISKDFQLKKNIKLFLTVSLIIFFNANIFCQTENTSAENSITETSQKKFDSSKITVIPYLNLSTQLMINNASKEISAPSPVLFSFGGGAIIGLTDLITLEPHLDFWTQYYLFNKEDALPAEVEHRTATMLCFMLDIPVGFNFKIGNHTLTPGAGLGFLIRFGLLSNGVKANDKGYSGSAQSDVDKINSWMWNNARFLYPEIFFAWDYKISEKFRAGLVARWYIPVGSLIDGKGLDASILNLSARFIF